MPGAGANFTGFGTRSPFHHSSTFRPFGPPPDAAKAAPLSSDVRYIMSDSDDYVASVEEAVSSLQRDLGIEGRFLEKLIDEDDWSFVIKSHAFIEAALSHLISDSISEPTLDSIFANLETSNQKSGKLAFIKKLNLLDKDARGFIRALSELRNSLVHDVSQVSFSFEAHVLSLDSQQKKSFVKFFAYFANGASFQISEQTFETELFVTANPKRSAWFCVMALSAVIYLAKERVMLEKMIRSFESDVANSTRKTT